MPGRRRDFTRHHDDASFASNVIGQCRQLASLLLLPISRPLGDKARYTISVEFDTGLYY